MIDQTTSATAQPVNTLPVLVLDGAVVFPHTIARLPLDKHTAPATEASLRSGRLVLLAARREDAASDAPLALQLYRVGVVARIEESGTLRDGTPGLIVRGLHRATLGDEIQTMPYPLFSFTEQPDLVLPSPELEQLTADVHAAIDAVLTLRGDVAPEVRNFVRSITDPGQLADHTGYSADYTFAERQELLETFDVRARLQKVLDFYRKQLTLLEVQTRLRQEMHEGAAKQQRDFFLRQQKRAIEKELGEEDADAGELDDLRTKLAELKLSTEARTEIDREMSRLARMNSASPDYQMVRSYLELVSELPWGVSTGNPIDVGHARDVLNQDHYGLERIKERILEHLAVKQRLQGRKAEDGERGREPILALVGPPGVGKTSLGQSVARALGRKFIRISLGGVRDEAELRGFRRTYIGSAPGRIIQELRRAGAADPVILLDEVDKLGSDYRGDPAAALLEVLDPEQNDTFTDHYLNLPFDLSNILFIATANSWETVPPALRDRMEVIELSGYIEDEKVRIAQEHLLPKQLRANGLEPSEVMVEEAALRTLIGDYTREAGVRNLERQIGSVLRRVTRRLTEGEVIATPFIVGPTFVRDVLGRARFHNEAQERIDQPGISTGMVWTPVGGDIVFVETAVVPGTGGLKITGQLGDVMRESAEAALTFVRSRSQRLGIAPNFFDTHTVHIHVPGGAIPKDGPSAGITMATALASAATGRLVRDDVAMTGEITLRGKVLPIGGIREKALGAHRAGIRTIILPSRNMDDLDEMPRDVYDELTWVPVDTLDEVLATALTPATIEPWTTLEGLHSLETQLEHLAA